MRRGSLTPLTSQSSCGEPVIVVDDAELIIEEEPFDTDSSGHGGCRLGLDSTQQSLDLESPTSCNPYLLSPWRDPRDTRKHSLPTPQCSGITASQVRRLSDRGGEGPSPREAAFLATLSTAPAPSPGGRRHSVVTISKVPTTLFGRNRRESIAAYPTAVPPRILGNRRESIAGIIGPPSTEHLGSIHNLQLDIMDDIVTARKVRMKMWNTSNEKVCEVQPLDESGAAACGQRYTQQATSSLRRYSDFVGAQLAPIPSEKRRGSELPGIICTNTDLISILSNLTSSATEINNDSTKLTQTNKTPPNLEQKRNRLKNNRSNSFDVSILVDQSAENTDVLGMNPASWFVKRHQPMSKKKIKDTKEENKTKEGKENKAEAAKVVWDGRSGSIVDAEKLGSAIEVFLRRSENNLADASKGAIPKTTKTGNTNPSGWYSAKDGDDDNNETCDTSLCSTLKDLFVK